MTSLYRNLTHLILDLGPTEPFTFFFFFLLAININFLTQTQRLEIANILFFKCKGRQPRRYHTGMYAGLRVIVRKAADGQCR